MKKLLIVFSTFLIATFSFAQGIEMESSISTSSKPAFGINYQFKPIDSLIQIGLGVNENKYTGSFIALNGFPFYPFDRFTQVNFNMKRTSFRFNLFFVLRENKYFFWTAGADIDYYIFRGKETVTYYYADSANKFTTNQTSVNYRMVNAWGLALLSKIEIKNIFTPRLSICFTIRPAFIYFSNPWLRSDTPVSDLFSGVSGELEFQVGLKYNFYKK